MQANLSQIFTLKVDNEFGVLTRITALIRRAGWNIRSLSVNETEKREVSRLTICLECKNNTLEYVLDKLGKQGCVKEISVFSPETEVAQELAIVRVSADGAAHVRQHYEQNIVKVLNSGSDEQVLSIAAEPESMETLLKDLREHGLLEVARTGTIVLKLPTTEEQNEKS